PSAAAPRESGEERLIQVGDFAIPERLEPLMRKDAPNRSAATNATPSDEELLLLIYKKTDDFSQKAALTWALAYIGNAEVATNFLWQVSSRFRWREISQEQEELCLETIQALGFLAARYEAAFELLRKGANPSWWQEHQYWLAP